METKRTIETGAGPVVVRKLPLFEYAELIRKFKKLPKEMAFLFDSDKDIKNFDVLFAELPEVIAESWPDFIGILSVATDKDEEFFKSEQLDFADGVDLVLAALELNDYKRVVASIKKLMARGQELAKPDQTNSQQTAQ